MSVLALLLGAEPDPRLRALVSVLAERVRVVGIDPDDHPADAYLCAADPARPPAGARWAAWTGPRPAAPEVVSGAEVLLVPADEDQPGTGQRRLLVPTPVGDDLAGAARPVAPFTRRRIRTARGLTGPALVRAGDDHLNWDGEAVDPSLLATALATGAAVVATGPAAVAALAWGAPTVLTPADAHALGAVDGTHVLVGSDARTRDGLAADLAGDDRLAAQLGRRARDLFETRHSVRTTALALADALGLANRPVDRLEDAAAALGSPEDSHIRRRVRTATATLRRPTGGRP